MSRKFKVFLGYGLLDPSNNNLVRHKITGTHSISFTFTDDVSLATCESLEEIEALKERVFSNHKIVKIYKKNKTYTYS